LESVRTVQSSSPTGSGNATNGVQPQLYDCNNQWPRKWWLPDGSGVSYSDGRTTGTSCGVRCHLGSDHYSGRTGATATITATGRIALLCGRDIGNGIAALSIDGGPGRDGEGILWVSPSLMPGSHVRRIRNASSKNPAAQAAFIGFDRAEVYP
jgi:hypothetical protein